MLIEIGKNVLFLLAISSPALVFYAMDRLENYLDKRELRRYMKKSR